LSWERKKCKEEINEQKFWMNKSMFGQKPVPEFAHHGACTPLTATGAKTKKRALKKQSFWV